MFNHMGVRLLKKTVLKVALWLLDVIIYGTLSSVIAFYLSLFLSKRLLNIGIYDLMFIIGILIVCAGIFSAIGGNPSGIYMGGPGLGSQYASIFNNEVTLMERKITNYYTSAKNHTKLYFTRGTLNIAANGIFVILVSIILNK